MARLQHGSVRALPDTDQSSAASAGWCGSRESLLPPASAGSLNRITHLCRQPFLCPRCTRASKRSFREKSSFTLKKSGWLRGSDSSLSPAPHPRYRTSSQAYGSKAPTVHEVPTSFHVTSHTFSKTLAQCGMYRNNGLNTSLEKSHVTGVSNFITAHDHLDFHPSYNASGPSHC
uniref:Chromosome 9 open reading frame 116 n=1 Tax=Falco tinnunculus TaxID=100819 RepID=A0A8C4XMY5_FALTI